MANNSPIHIHEIPDLLTSTDMDGNELFVVSNPNEPSGYSTSKLTLNSLADFVNAQIPGNVVTQTGMLTESQGFPLTFGINEGVLCVFGYGKLFPSNNQNTINIGNLSYTQIQCSNVAMGAEASSSILDNCTIVLPDYNIEEYNGDNSKISVFTDVSASGLVIPANIFNTFKIVAKNGSAETTNGSSWVIQNDDSYIKTEFIATGPGTYNFTLKAGTYDYTAIGFGGRVAIRYANILTGNVTHAATGDSADIVKGWFTIDEDSVATAYIHQDKNHYYGTTHCDNFADENALTYDTNGNTYLSINGVKVIDAPYAGGWKINGAYPTNSTYSYYTPNHASPGAQITEIIPGKKGTSSIISSPSHKDDTQYADNNYPYGGSNGFTGTGGYMAHKTKNVYGYLELRRREDPQS